MRVIMRVWLRLDVIKHVLSLVTNTVIMSVGITHVLSEYMYSSNKNNNNNKTTICKAP